MRLSAKRMPWSTLAILPFTLVCYIFVYGLNPPALYPSQDVFPQPIPHFKSEDQKWYTKPFDIIPKTEIKPMHYCMSDGKRAWMARFNNISIVKRLLEINCRDNLDADIDGIALYPISCWCESYQNHPGYCEKAIAAWISEDEDCQRLLKDFNSKKEMERNHGLMDFLFPPSTEHYFTVSHHTDSRWRRILGQEAYEKEIQLMPQAELIPESGCRGRQKRWSTNVNLGWSIGYKWMKCEEVEADIHGKLVKPDSCECLTPGYPMTSCDRKKLHWLIDDTHCSGG